jgi:hypothetical protein
MGRCWSWSSNIDCLVVGKSYFSLSTSNSSKLTSGVSSNVDGLKKRYCLGRWQFEASQINLVRTILGQPKVLGGVVQPMSLDHWILGVNEGFPLERNGRQGAVLGSGGTRPRWWHVAIGGQLARQTGHPRIRYVGMGQHRCIMIIMIHIFIIVGYCWIVWGDENLFVYFDVYNVYILPCSPGFQISPQLPHVQVSCNFAQGGQTCTTFKECGWNLCPPAPVMFDISSLAPSIWICMCSRTQRRSTNRLRLDAANSHPAEHRWTKILRHRLIGRSIHAWIWWTFHNY